MRSSRRNTPRRRSSRTVRATRPARNLGPAFRSPTPSPPGDRSPDCAFGQFPVNYAPTLWDTARTVPDRVPVAGLQRSGGCGGRVRARRCGSRRCGRGCTCSPTTFVPAVSTTSARATTVAHSGRGPAFVWVVRSVRLPVGGPSAYRSPRCRRAAHRSGGGCQLGRRSGVAESPVGRTRSVSSSVNSSA